MTETFQFRGYDLPVDLVNKTGGGPESFGEVADWHIGLLQKYIGIRDTDHVLEIGCGIGRDAIPLTQLLVRGHYTGTDTIEPSIRWCSENISVKFPNFVFVHHDIKDTLHNPAGTLHASDVRLPAQGDSIDLIILQSVFTHMFRDEIIHYMREFRRVLKPTGRVWATFFVVNQGILDAIRNDPQTRYALSFQHPHGPGCHVHVLEEPRGAVAFEEETVREIVEEGGLALAQPILWGTWSGQRPEPAAGQDALILTRNVGSTPAE
jgi:SAM-dependent methyltransferase